MAKDKFSRTKACATKTLYAVMKEMSRRGGSIPAKEIYPFVNENVELIGRKNRQARCNISVGRIVSSSIPLTIRRLVSSLRKTVHGISHLRAKRL